MAKDKQRLVPFITGNGNPLLAQSTDRNSLCPCGSGKKSKKCCNPKTVYQYETPRTR